MIVDKLELGFATVNVTVNGKSIDFKIEKDPYDFYMLNGETEVHAEGCMDIEIDLLPLSIGDKIVVEFDKGTLQCDGGGQGMLNLVGEIAEFTVGIGVPDTEEYEDEYADIKKGWPEDMNPTKRMLPYELQTYTERGFEFLIVDNPRNYNDRAFRKRLLVDIVWEYSSKSYAWNIVSLHTC